MSGSKHCYRLPKLFISMVIKMFVLPSQVCLELKDFHLVSFDNMQRSEKLRTNFVLLSFSKMLSVTICKNSTRTFSKFLNKMRWKSALTAFPIEPPIGRREVADSQPHGVRLSSVFGYPVEHERVQSDECYYKYFSGSLWKLSHHIV